MKVGLKYIALDEYQPTDYQYQYINYIIRIGDIIEISELKSTSYGVIVKTGLIVRIPKGILEDKTYFKPYFRDKNLNDILQ